jgi:immunity protein 27 of polymorphic toxin system
MRIRPEEVELVGDWLLEDGKPRIDATADRIDQLTGGYLDLVATDTDGWSKLYVDPADGRYWELTYPQGEMHGGGPPRLAVVSQKDASFKYDLRPAGPETPIAK